MCLGELLKFAQIVQNLVVAVGIVVGGLWAFYRFARHRESETSLTIDISSMVSRYANTDYLALIEVILKNTCRTKIEVYSPHDGTPVYSDARENLKHSVSLQIRRVNQWDHPEVELRELNGFVAWTESGCHVYAWRFCSFFTADIYSCKKFNAEDVISHAAKFFHSTDLVYRCN